MTDPISKTRARDIERDPLLLDQGIAASDGGADGNLIGIERDEGFSRANPQRRSE
jgi:hypothetical protein